MKLKEKMDKHEKAQKIARDIKRLERELDREMRMSELFMEQMFFDNDMTSNCDSFEFLITQN